MKFRSVRWRFFAVRLSLIGGRVTRVAAGDGGGGGGWWRWCRRKRRWNVEGGSMNLGVGECCIWSNLGFLRAWSCVFWSIGGFVPSPRVRWWWSLCARTLGDFIGYTLHAFLMVSLWARGSGDLNNWAKEQPWHLRRMNLLLTLHLLLLPQIFVCKSSGYMRLYRCVFVCYYALFLFFPISVF